MTDNLLDPIEFNNPGEAGKFCNRNACAMCQGHLMVKLTDAGMYRISCPNCGERHPTEVIDLSISETVKHNERMGARELRPERPPRSTDDILKELGY